jgi:hypothetical protein
MKLISMCRSLGLGTVCCGALAVSGPASAIAAQPVTYKAGASVFVSGPADQAVLMNGGGLKDDFGSNWSGLLPTWRAYWGDQRWLAAGVFQLTGDPSVTFTGTSTYAALNEFGSSPGQVDPTQDPVADAQSPPALDAFITTDEAPQNPQRTWAQTASGFGEQELPVAQTPVVLIFSLPSGITLGARARMNLINNGSGDGVSTLQAIFDDKVGPSGGYPANTWGALLQRAGFTRVATGSPTDTQFIDLGSASAGTGGYQPLELEVRKGDAPETSALQTFLSISGDHNLTDPSDAERGWPSDANDGAGSNGYPAGPFGPNTDGSTLVRNTLATPGAIGYAVLGDTVFAVPGDSFTPAPQATTYGGSAAHQFLSAGVQSDEGAVGARHYADPGAVWTNASGALEAIPNLYTGPSSGGCPGGYSLTQSDGVGDWCLSYDAQGLQYSGSLASDPAVYQHSATPNEPSVDAYPIAEVAFATGWFAYGTLTKLYGTKTNALDTGNTVVSFLEWLTKATGGQAAITSSKVGWERLPSFEALSSNGEVGQISDFDDLG